MMSAILNNLQAGAFGTPAPARAATAAINKLPARSKRCKDAKSRPQQRESELATAAASRHCGPQVTLMSSLDYFCCLNKQEVGIVPK